MDAIYKAYHMPAKGSRDYITADLAGDLLGRSKSSRLHPEACKINRFSITLTHISPEVLIPVCWSFQEKSILVKVLRMLRKYIIEEIQKMQI
jgi:hypothetical protein